MTDYVYIIIPAGEPTIKVIESTHNIGLKPLQEGVDGLITLVPMEYASTILKDVDMFANDEGLLKKLKANMLATILSGIPLVGDVVLCKSDEEGASIAFTFQEGTELAQQIVQECKKFLREDNDIERINEVPGNFLQAFLKN